MKNIMVFVAVGILFLGAFSLMNSGSGGKDCKMENAHGKSEEIIFTDKKVTPKCIVVLTGETIEWVNKAKAKVQVGVDPHPVHSGVRELSGGNFVLELEPGERKSVIMRKKGKFGYHDHLNPGIEGSIVVE